MSFFVNWEHLLPSGSYAISVTIDGSIMPTGENITEEFTVTYRDADGNKHTKKFPLSRYEIKVKSGNEITLVKKSTKINWKKQLGGT